jgi:peptide subunit release factor RF-3
MGAVRREGEANDMQFLQACAGHFPDGCKASVMPVTYSDGAVTRCHANMARDRDISSRTAAGGTAGLPSASHAQVRDAVKDF